MPERARQRGSRMHVPMFSAAGAATPARPAASVRAGGPSTITQGIPRTTPRSWCLILGWRRDPSRRWTRDSDRLGSVVVVGPGLLAHLPAPTLPSSGACSAKADETVHCERQASMHNKTRRLRRQRLDQQDLSGTWHVRMVRVVCRGIGEGLGRALTHQLMPWLGSLAIGLLSCGQHLPHIQGLFS